MMDGNKKKKRPFLLFLPGLFHTVAMLLANGPEVGLPFIIVFGVPKSQQERFQEYFLHIWLNYAGCSAAMPSEGHVRAAQGVESAERDRMGITVRPYPAIDNLLASCRVLRLLRERWPEAGMVQMGLTIPPVSLGAALPA